MYDNYIGLKFRGVRSNEIYTLSNIKEHVRPQFHATKNINVVKPKMKLAYVLREISLVPKYKRVPILVKDIEVGGTGVGKIEHLSPKTSWIIKRSNNLVDNTGRLRISWKEKLILVDDEKD